MFQLDVILCKIVIVNRKEVIILNRYKYPRTQHLPYSLGATNDDKILDSDDIFYDKDVVITIKMDGENTSVYSDGFVHARSLDSGHKSYHSWLMNNIQHWYYLLPENYRVCGEYLFAKHSIGYESLPSYFEAFSVWSNAECLSWKDTLDIIKSLGIFHVPIVYEGLYDSRKIQHIAEEVVSDGHEGIVVRSTDSFTIGTFDKNIAKYVRSNHVQTDKHWSQSEVISNKLAK